MGINADEIKIPEEIWEDLQTIGSPPPLIPELFLNNREEACENLFRVFSGQSLLLKIGTFYPDQFIPFIVAYFNTLDDEEKVEFGGRCLIISGINAWDSIVNKKEPHVLIVEFDLDEKSATGILLLSKAQRNRHSVVYRGVPGGSPEPNCAIIANPTSTQTQRALLNAGYPDQRARVLSQKCNGNLTHLLHYLLHASILPEWSQHSDAAELALASLIGSWDINSVADREIVEKLVGNSYGEWIRKIQNLSLIPDTPLTIIDGIWKFTSRYEGWYALGPKIFDEHLFRLNKVITTVLSEKDPKFDLPANERFAAIIHGKKLQYSYYIRKGLAECLALLGNHYNGLTSCSLGKAEDTALIITREIFKDADWILWASLDNILPLIAEGSPSEYLEVIETALLDKNCPFDQLFAQETSDSNYISGLLWSLESLAWDPEYFGRVILILGDLSLKDPGGKWLNRPINSLTSIFLPWLPQTCASYNQRKVIIETLIKENPNIAWKLLISLLPGSTQSSSGTYKPIWRNIIPEDWSSNLSNQEYFVQVQDFSHMVFLLAKSDQTKFIELIDYLDKLPQPTYKKVITYLKSKEFLSISEHLKQEIWAKLISYIKMHQRFPDAKWVMKPEKLKDLKSVIKKIEPSNPFHKHKSLFSASSLDWITKEKSHEEVELERKNLQNIAVIEILKTGGFESLLKFTRTVEQPWAVGSAYGNINENDNFSSILPKLINNEDKSLSQFSGGYINTRFNLLGWTWVDSIEKTNWDPSQLGQFFTYLPFSSDTWDRVNSFNHDTIAEYWKRTTIIPNKIDKSLLFAVDQFINNNRGFAAIDCLYRLFTKINFLDSEIIITALFTIQQSEEQINQYIIYEIIELIKAIQKDPNVNTDNLIKIEWVFLPLIKFESDIFPKTIEQRMADNPQYFCYLIKLVFHNSVEALSNNEGKEKSILKNGYQILNNWRIIPGIKNEIFDSSHFLYWIEEVEKETTKTGHLDIAQIIIGQVLINAPNDPDGLWIHQSIANILNKKDGKNLREGFTTALFNSRGVHFYSSGEEENKLSFEYNQKADSLEKYGYHRFASSLRQLSKEYCRDAEREKKRSFGE